MSTPSAMPRARAQSAKQSAMAVWLPLALPPLFLAAGRSEWLGSALPAKSTLDAPILQYEIACMQKATRPETNSQYVSRQTVVSFLMIDTDHPLRYTTTTIAQTGADSRAAPYLGLRKEENHARPLCTGEKRPDRDLHGTGPAPRRSGRRRRDRAHGQVQGDHGRVSLAKRPSTAPYQKTCGFAQGGR